MKHFNPQHILSSDRSYALRRRGINLNPNFGSLPIYFNNYNLPNNIINTITKSSDDIISNAFENDIYHNNNTKNCLL